MPMTLNKFGNDMLNLLANDCGLTIVPRNVDVTTNEIEFFSTQIIRECIDVVGDDAKKAIKNHFNLDNEPDNRQLELF